MSQEVFYLAAGRRSRARYCVRDTVSGFGFHTIILNLSVAVLDSVFGILFGILVCRIRYTTILQFETCGTGFFDRKCHNLRISRNCYSEVFSNISFLIQLKNRTIYTMKISVVFFLCLIDGAAAAFAPATHPLAFKPATLSLSSISPDGFRRNKPLYKPKDTTPVPVHNVNFLQRALIGDVVLDPDYTLTWSLALLGGLIILYHPCKL